MSATFFPTPAAFRRWLEKNHAQEKELWVGMYKVGSGRKSITWPQAVDEALCYGWIDGIRKSIDADSYMNRFTPRRPTSNWSAINIKRVHELIAEGRMTPAGLAAFEKRNDRRIGRYSFEQTKEIVLDDAQEREFRRHRKAWEYFQAQRPSYRKQATWWVISAKREETRARRLATLIADSAEGRWIGGAMLAKKDSQPAKRGRNA